MRSRVTAGQGTKRNSYKRRLLLLSTTILHQLCLPAKAMTCPMLDYLLTYPLHPLWDIRLQQYSSTGSCPLLRSEPCHTTAPPTLAPPLLSSAMLSLVVLASFFRVASILRQLWGYCLRAFSGRVLANSIVGV